MCLVAQPYVERLKLEIAGEATVLQVDVGSKAGHRIARLYGARATPTFIVLSPSRSVIYQKSGGFPDKEAILAAIHRGSFSRDLR